MFRRPLCTRFLSRNAARFATITPIGMPALSPTMEQGKIVEWLKKVGDKVDNGDTWCRLETDKATAAFDNVSEEGYLARIVKEASGDMVPVGHTICLLVDEEADVNSADVKNWKAPAEESGAAPAAAAPAEPAAPATESSRPPESVPARSGGRVFASPLAKNLAKELGLELSSIKGTGGNVGRITKNDVVLAAKNPPEQTTTSAAVSAPPVAVPAAATSTAPTMAPAAGAIYVDEPVSSMRMTIAKRLTQSKNVDVPHYYETNECVADNMLAVLKALNAKGKGEYKISVNDFIVKAIARANLIVPACNSQWNGTFIRRFSTVDVSVAVATPTGLITPIIRNAHAKGLAEISIETKALAKKARDGTLSPEEYQGGTVTISNLGAMGTQQFTAIINPPQSMILAVGTTVPKPEIVKDEETGDFQMTGKVHQTIAFTASFDHRVVDGAMGAEWFKHFKDAIENPLSLLL